MRKFLATMLLTTSTKPILSAKGLAMHVNFDGISRPITVAI